MSEQSTPGPVQASGSVSFGRLSVRRLGYGAMQFSGPGVWGPSDDPAESIRVLRRAVDLGVTVIDTADSYGPYLCEDLIREALHPYPADLVIATKGGLTRAGPNDWRPVGRAAYLRQCVEMSLRRLRVEQIDLYQLHRVDDRTPVEESIGQLAAMQQEGKIRHIGVSEVDVDTLVKMREIADIVSVQNLYNLADRHYEDVLDYCEREGICFIPWFPLATGRLIRHGGPLAKAAEAHGATPAQLALAWLLRRSPVMVPIPGTSSVAHLEENCLAAGIALSDEEYEALEAAGKERRLRRIIR